MISITYKEYKNGAVSIRIKGHAGTAEKGKDLVCAGVSTLAYTLAQNVADFSDKLKISPTINMREGNANIRFTPKHKYRALILLITRAIFRGFEAMQANYPNNIKIVIATK